MLRNSLIVVLTVVLSCNQTDKKLKAKTTVNHELELRNFIVSTTKTSDPQRTQSLDSILNANSNDSTQTHNAFSFLEKAFGDPNSPYRNEALYARLLAKKTKSPWYNTLIQQQARDRLHLILQNRVGSAANNFEYTTPRGSKKKLYDLNAPYTLLYFYNPECDACKEMKEAITASPVITARAVSGQLKILAIYTNQDENVWRKHLPKMPSYWLHGKDNNEYLYKNKIYDLRAIPTIYLLDQNKKVLLKDCMLVKAIEDELPVVF